MERGEKLKMEATLHLRDRNEEYRKEAVRHLKSILTQTLPLCKDGNPHEEEFREINRKAHQALWLVERV